MNLSNMFPASGGLAAQIKKPVATAVAKPTDNKAVGSSLADCMQTRNVRENGRSNGRNFVSKVLKTTDRFLLYRKLLITVTVVRKPG